MLVGRDRNKTKLYSILPCESLCGEIQNIERGKRGLEVCCSEIQSRCESKTW